MTLDDAKSGLKTTLTKIGEVVSKGVEKLQDVISADPDSAFALAMGAVGFVVVTIASSFWVALGVFLMLWANNVAKGY